MSSISKEVIHDCGKIIVESIAKALECKNNFEIKRLSDGNLILAEQSAAYLGSRIMIHSHLTNSPFTKVHFENGLEEALNLAALPDCRVAELAEVGNPGHDITIRTEQYSLKTQADKSIKMDSIHISKWMELGRNPNWSDNEDVLPELRDEFLNHMQGYERILVLRCLPGHKAGSTYERYYELVEIPKEFLLLCRKGTFEMKHKSKQNPKPGYCYVNDSEGNLLFSLYFDGGGERKLQIKNILKSSCLVHATWEFDV